MERSKSCHNDEGVDNERVWSLMQPFYIITYFLQAKVCERIRLKWLLICI